LDGDGVAVADIVEDGDVDIDGEALGEGVPLAGTPRVSEALRLAVLVALRLMELVLVLENETLGVPDAVPLAENAGGVMVALVDCDGVALGLGGVFPQHTTASAAETAHDQVSPALTDTKGPPEAGAPLHCPYASLP
jgi:hypothetical protein